MNTGKKICIAIMATLLMACGSKKENNNMEAFVAIANGLSQSQNAAGGVAEEKKEADAAAPVVSVMERKLIKNGDISFKTSSLIETKKKVQTVLTELNGYIAKETAYDYSENPSEELTVRVPSKDFDVFMDKILEGVDELDSKHIDIQDVTEEFVDIEARLKNKKQLETKYQELLSKTNNMDEILRIEKEISSIREEIESTEGRLKYLGNQVSYSTLQIRYYEKRTGGFNFGGKLGDALKNGSTGFLWFLIFMVQMWPLWIIGGCIWWFIVWLIRRRRMNRKV